MTLVHYELSTRLVTVIVVDAMPVMRDGIRTVLAGEPDIKVAAEAATGRDAVQLAAGHRPDVLVADLPSNELAATCREVQRFGTATVAFTDQQDDTSVLAAIRAGVLGHLPKSASPDDLVRAVRGVAGGHVIFGAHVADRVTRLLFSKPADPLDRLTPREREILDLMAVGLSNPAIAHRLRVTAKTIRNYASGIVTKLGVPGRAEAIGLARNLGQ
ncbi:LuxR C-terminal-related transcriptional regulator [Actinocrispum wychmicini]|uniref:DNA-binding NarL/FixJ family response regulator n=1 Tax=Actinocrispum wychmicini TaxID=1213861 RepID=A0A4R2JZE3_9PSEU|nr:response regulator transcription factor [Actinocrispum wychmicini]TCO62669.1 DNA-binding NarL/FixJ family response regulator [Actinocrispum wychmicini]